MNVERIVFKGKLPEPFFEIADKPYLGLPFQLQEDAEITLKIFNLQSARNEIVLYTDFENVRLAGIFPHDKKYAYFGYWETTDNLNLNTVAFSLLEKDALNKDRTEIIGPLNFNTFHNYRLRNNLPPWNAFDREPVNPEYYLSLLNKLGYSVRSQFESRYVAKAMVPDFYANKQKFIERLNSLPLNILPLTPNAWKEYEKEIYCFVNETFGNNPSFQLISEEEFGLLYNLKFAEKLCPYSSVLFTDKITGKIAALSFCQPNYQSLGRAVPAPTFRSDFEKLPIKTLLIKSVGVHPDYRNMNLMSYLGAYAMQSFKKFYDDAIFCLMRSDNVSTNFTRGLPYISSKYFLFEKKLS